LRKDGTIENVNLYGRVFNDPTGYPGATREVVMSVTPDQPLEQSEALPTAILESLHDHIAVIDRSGIIICTNPAWQDFGQCNEVIDAARISSGVNYLDVCRRAAVNDDATGKKALEGIEAVLDGSSQHFSIEYECSGPDERRWFVMTVSPLHRSLGGAVITHRNVTQRRETNRRLRDSYDEIVRLKGELQQQLRFESLISQLSARFVNVLCSDVDSEIESALEQVRSFFQVDRCGLFEVADDGKEMRSIHMVVGAGMLRVMPLTQTHNQLPWVFEKVIRAGEPLFLDSLSDIPGHAADGTRYAEDGIKSITLIPIVMNMQVRYVMTVAAVRNSCAWPPGIAPRLQLLGETLVNAITRRTMESAQKQLLAFQSLIGDISARFVHLASDALDEEIDRALSRILHFFDADQCGIFRLNPEKGAAHLSHVQAADGISPAPIGGIYAERFPWATRELNEGRVVSFGKLDDLPAEAEADKHAFEHCGLVAGLNIPISTGGNARFAFGISCNRQLKSCPASYVPRLRLLGETLANAVIRSEAEKASKAANLRLEYALNATARGMWDWNIRTGEVYYSKNWIESLGYTREEVPPHVSFWENVIHPDDMPRVRKALLAHFKGETPTCRVENRLRLKSGEYRWNVDHGRVVERAADGTPLRMVGTDTDITERKQVQAEMRAMRDRLWHTDRVMRIGTLSASIAHEINQPLAAILSNAQAAARLLARPSVDIGEIREIIGDIERDDKRAGAVISSLRAMLGGQTRHREELDVAEVARSVLNILHSELLVAHIKLRTRLATGCMVYADKAQLQQVILNLIMNAVESMQDVRADARTISVSVRRMKRQTVILAVRDTGPGISREKVDEVFEPFLTTKAEGMGLGLAVSRSIVEAHAGKIWAESSESAGAAFYFELPLRGPDDVANMPR
jgi:PAS domain S-box-containing protein